MKITTDDPDTLSGMLLNTLQRGWHIQLRLRDPLTQRRSVLEAVYRDVVGNEIRAYTLGGEPLSYDLQYVTGLHIY